MIASVIAFAFVSRVAIAATALSATLSTPFSESHFAISSGHAGCAEAMSEHLLRQRWFENQMAWDSSLV